MMQALLETGARVSEFVALRVEDISLIERVVIIENGKGGKRREVPIRPELARLLSLHIGKRRAGPLFPSREKGTVLHGSPLIAGGRPSESSGQTVQSSYPAAKEKAGGSDRQAQPWQPLAAVPED
jgi:integrase